MTQATKFFPSAVRSVLVPFDFSMAARGALDVATTHVDDPGAVSVLYVVEPPPRFMPGSFMRLEEDRESTLAQSQRALEEALRESGHGECRGYVELGDPGTLVAEFAQKHGVDLIVIPSNGRTGMSRLLIGSVAERVVRLAECPVLVLKVPEPQAE
jgi:nucleotide-binding universal stress UspA family protein